MRTNLISGFQLSVNYWFDLVLQGMGGPIRDWVYDFLDKKGIKRDDIPARFGDVVKILHERLGTSARVIAYRTMVALYKEFSLNANFDYEDSIEDRLVFLKERVLEERLHPTRTPSLKLAFYTPLRDTAIRKGRSDSQAASGPEDRFCVVRINY